MGKGGKDFEKKAYNYYTVSEEVLKTLNIGDVFSIPEVGECTVRSGGIESGYISLQNENGSIFEIQKRESDDWRILEVYWDYMTYYLGESTLFIPTSATMINRYYPDETVESPRDLWFYYYNGSKKVYADGAVDVEITFVDGTITSVVNVFHP